MDGGVDFGTQQKKSNVPLEIMMPVREVDVILMEDSSPLEWRGMLFLTSPTMAQLAVQGLFTTQLVFDLLAVTAGFVYDLEVLGFVVHLVWWTLLPLVLALCTGACLMCAWVVGGVSVVLHAVFFRDWRHGLMD